MRRGLRSIGFGAFGGTRIVLSTVLAIRTIETAPFEYDPNVAYDFLHFGSALPTKNW